MSTPAPLTSFWIVTEVTQSRPRLRIAWRTPEKRCIRRRGSVIPCGSVNAAGHSRLLSDLDRLQQRDELGRPPARGGIGAEATPDEDAAEAGLQVVDRRPHCSELLRGPGPRLGGGRSEE